MTRPIKTLLIISALLLFLIGISLTLASFLPLEELKGYFDSFAKDGDFTSFSTKHVLKLRFAGIFISVVTILVYMTRKRIQQYLSNVNPTDYLIRPKDILALILGFIRDWKELLKKEDKIHIGAFIFIILIAIAARIYYMSQPFLVDESRIFIQNIYPATMGPNNIWTVLTNYSDNGNHIFHTILVFITYTLFGSENSTWVIRLPALFAGILLVPSSYMVARIFHNKNAALLASGIIASSSALIFYSCQARAYTIICLIFTLLLSLGVYLKKNNTTAGWHLFAIIAAIGFYAQPVMLYPYGIVITWLSLSIVFKDIAAERSDVIRNLIISIVITGLSTFLLYSPVIFFGSGLTSIVAKKSWNELVVTIATLPQGVLDAWLISWGDWKLSIPTLLLYVLIFSFILSLALHKKTNTQRVPVALAVLIWLPTVFLLQRIVPWWTRTWLFLLPFYITLASAGMIYLLKPVENAFSKHKTIIFALLAITISIVMVGNKVRSEPYLTSFQELDVDSSGEYIEFKFITVAINENSIKHNVKTLVLFPSPLKNEFWKARIVYYFKRWVDEKIITDLNSYFPGDSSKCRDFMVITDEAPPALVALLKKNGVPVSNYEMPELLQKFKYAQLYKLRWAKDCNRK